MKAFAKVGSIASVGITEKKGMTVHPLHVKIA